MGLGKLLKKAVSNPLVQSAAALVPGVSSALPFLAGGEQGGGESDLRGDEARAQAEIQARIGKLRAIYGEGDTPDAQAAKAGIDRFIAQLSGESEGEAISQAGDIYQADRRTADESMYSRGLVGGSADLEARRQTLESFVRNRQKIANASKASADATRSGLQQERLGLEREIAQGTKADPTWNVTAGQRQTQLAGSWQKAWQDQLGVLADGVGAGVAGAMDRGATTSTPQTRMTARQQSNVDFFNNAARSP